MMVRGIAGRSLWMLGVVAACAGETSPDETGGPDETGTAEETGARPEETSFTLQIPSDVAGDLGIAVEVLVPASPRFADGAPIAVEVHGGWKSGSANPAPELPGWGVISVGWVEPGASKPMGASGGRQDVRGADTLQALADVVRYASGELADVEGLRITDRVAFALTDEVGLMAGSNGGNMALAMLARHASEASAVDWLAAWESPLGDQQANVELNDDPFYDPGACDAAGCPFGTGFSAALSWDASGQSEARHDGMASFAGRLVLEGAPETYLQSLPSGFDGDRVFLVPSVELAAVIRAQGPAFFEPGSPPPWLKLDAAEVNAYWELRDGSRSITAVHSAFPDLLVIHGQRVSDHVQTQPDYPHATAHLRGWKEAGHAWFRLNPDAVYQALAIGSDDPSGFVENEAGVEVAFPGAAEQMVPDGQGGSLKTAMVLELVDRVHVGETATDLDATLQ